jgi:hypothetical protein
MKRTLAVLSVLSFTLIMTVAAVAQAPSTKAKPEQLSKQQLNTLISTANTPAEHQRIASFYEANALDYRAQAQEHEAMILTYKSNSSLSNDKNRASTIGHCEYFVKSLNNLAAKNDELAQIHKEMAKEAGKK